MRYRELGNTRVLTNWQPSALDFDTIRCEFFSLARKFIGKLKISLCEVRRPGTVAQPIGFHRDVQGADMYLLVWSNKAPTQVGYPDGSVLEARAGDVILLRNCEVEHDGPACEDDYADRWFVRMYIFPTGHGGQYFNATLTAEGCVDF